MKMMAKKKKFTWVSRNGGIYVMRNKKPIACVWLATSGKDYMFWARNDTNSTATEFWYSDTQELSMQRAEKILNLAGF